MKELLVMFFVISRIIFLNILSDFINKVSFKVKYNQNTKQKFKMIAQEAAETAKIYNLAKTLNDRTTISSRTFSINESCKIINMHPNIRNAIVNILYTEKFTPIAKQASTAALIYNKSKNDNPLTIKKANKLATGEYYKHKFFLIAQRAAIAASINSHYKTLNKNNKLISIRHATKIAHMPLKLQSNICNAISRHVNLSPPCLITNKFFYYKNSSFNYINNNNILYGYFVLLKNHIAIDHIIKTHSKIYYQQLFADIVKDAATAAVIYNSLHQLDKLSFKIKEATKFATMNSNIRRPLINHTFLNDIAEHHYRKPRISSNKFLKEASKKLFSKLQQSFIQMNNNKQFTEMNTNKKYIIMVGILIHIIAKQHNYNTIISYKFTKDVVKIINSKLDNTNIQTLELQNQEAAGGGRIQRPYIQKILKQLKL
ncbi:hypothetical protein [Candidatus Neoehrlichia procyonis]|uniref:Uncharacterized protein n=1 Tax=Candidatus Neoehrlichia procyonis str. RAC413 TaxID=1359163 RepID=A0A0F3NMG2_9RICK|nr:hypothetical protein [Candidatus Neoehrlichia lotoris]KJV68897.1 hypothetical protein NLO413_0267 [Candidatus Neoehrlichia lotoris str. RAC413]